MIDLDKAQQVVNAVIKERMCDVEFFCSMDEEEKGVEWTAESVVIGDLDDEFDCTIGYYDGLLSFDVTSMRIFTIEQKTLYWLNEYNRESFLFCAFLQPKKNNADSAYLTFTFGAPAYDEQALERMMKAFVKAINELADSKAVQRLIDFGE